MRGATFRRACAVWLAIAIAESAHGALRRWLLLPLVGALPAHRIGVAVGALIVFAIACLSIRWIGATTRAQQFAVGALWAALMLGFEFGLGTALGTPATQILREYDPRHGGLMAFGIGFVLCAPVLAAKTRGMH